MSKYISNIKEQFKGKVVVITGSTQGIGAETAKLFASRGAKAITICGRNEKNGLKMFAFVEKLIRERCKPKTDIYGDELN